MSKHNQPNGVDAALACFFLVVIVAGVVVLKEQVVSAFADSVVQMLSVRSLR